MHDLTESRPHQIIKVCMRMMQLGGVASRHQSHEMHWSRFRMLTMFHDLEKRASERLLLMIMHSALQLPRGNHSSGGCSLNMSSSFWYVLFPELIWVQLNDIIDICRTETWSGNFYHIRLIVLRGKTTSVRPAPGWLWVLCPNQNPLSE